MAGYIYLHQFGKLVQLSREQQNNLPNFKMVFSIHSEKAAEHFERLRNVLRSLVQVKSRFEVAPNCFQGSLRIISINVIKLVTCEKHHIRCGLMVTDKENGEQYRCGMENCSEKRFFLEWDQDEYLEVCSKHFMFASGRGNISRKIWSSLKAEEVELFSKDELPAGHMIVSNPYA